MRVVADTNIVVSGFLWHGNPRLVLEAARDGFISLFTSGALLDELEDVLSRLTNHASAPSPDRCARRVRPGKARRGLKRRAQTVSRRPLARVATRRSRRTMRLVVSEQNDRRAG